jgi:putative transposase
VRRTVPPSVEIEEQIDRLLAVGVGESRRDALSELAKLGARLIIQRAVEEEFDAWLGRARYERRPEAPPGLRNGFRPRRLQTAEGELAVEIPQVRQAAEPFVSKLFPRGTKLLRSEPLRAMVIGAFVRGLSMRDVESLCDQAGLGKLSKSTAARICSELRDRFAAFQRRDLYQIHKQRLQALVDELDRAGYTAAARPWPTTWTRWSCICAIRPDTSGAGAARTCSSARSVRSSGAPR